MKKIIAFFLSMITASNLAAGPIDKATAFQIADQFMKDRCPSVCLQTTPRYNAPFRAGSNNNTTDYYVFNADNHEGFVIVSGDDRTMSQVLGYSETGTFDPDNIPEGLSMLLDLYSLQIQALSSETDEESITNGPRHSMSLARHPICPLDTFYFHSNEPYNYYAPLDTLGKQYGLGCTTVATAQILAYWQYPSETPAINGYSAGENSVEGIPAMAIDWKNILKTYVYRTNSEMPNTQIDAIASLMYRIAVASKLDFWTGGVLVNVVRTTLINTFGYDPSMAFYDISGTNNMNMAEDIIYNELANKRPVIMSGARLKTDPSSTAAHMFVVDGYEMDDMFHINWGWNSNMNGFYRLSAIDPYHHELLWNYMMEMRLLYGIKPLGTEGSSALDPDNYTKRLALTAMTGATTGTRAITMTLKNNLSVAYTFNQGLKILDSNNDLIELVEGNPLTLGPNESVQVVYTPDYSKYSNGTYYVKPISKLTSEDEWLSDEIISVNAYLRATLSKGTPVYRAVPALQFNSLEMEDHGPVVVGAPQYFNVSLTNNTDDKYGRYMYLYANDEIVQVRGVHIPANTTTVMHFGYEPTIEGTTHLVFASGTGYSNRFAQMDLEVEEANFFGDNLKMEVIVDNTDEKNDTVIYGDTFRAKIKVTNIGKKDYHDYLNFILRYSMQTWTAKPLADIPAGKSVTYDFEYTGLKKKSHYRFTTYFKRGSNFTFKESFNQRYYCHLREGYAYWTADGKVHTSTPKQVAYVVPEEAVAVNFAGNNVQPSSVTPNSNPNTLIYVEGSYYSYLNSLNVVRGGKAKNITITDGYPFYVPKDVMATKVSYIRNFEHGYGYDGTNWSTLVIPFVPQEIKDASTNRVIDWHHNSVEVGKDFWIREFYAEDGNDLYFIDAEELHAYRPYIIAVPDASFGEEFDLTDRDIVFSASNILLGANVNAFADAYHYNFEGTVSGRNTEGTNAYILNEGEGGNRFAYTSEVAELAPFRAMFTTSFEPVGNNGPLRIVGYKPTGIVPLQNSYSYNTSDVFTIDGRKIQTAKGSTKEILSKLPKGIYIIQGKKYIK